MFGAEDEQRHEQDDGRHHHQRDEDPEHEVAPSERPVGEPPGGERRDDEGDGDRGEGEEHRVAEPAGELIAERRPEAGERRIGDRHPGMLEEARLRLERRRDHHVDREEGDHRREDEQPVLRDRAGEAPTHRSRSRPPLDAEEGGDQHERDREQRRRRGRCDLRRLVLEGGLVDVELRHLGRVTRPALAVRHHVDVVEDPGDHRDRLDHDVEDDHARELRDRDPAVEPEEARPVHASRFEDVGGDGEQPGEEEDDPEAELAPDDHRRHRPERPAGLAEPVLRQPAEPDRPEHLIDEPVELEQLPEHDPDHRDREHVGQEERPAVEPPAAQPLEEQDRQEQRARDEDRDREQEPGVVAERRAEGRVGPRRCGSSRSSRRRRTGTRT